MIILLTGLPGVGKTTVLENVIRKYSGDCFWILSKEMRNAANERVGFTAVTSDDQKGIFAHKEFIQSDQNVGDYRVDLEVVDRLFTANILRELEHPSALFILDEIGRMEMLSENFVHAVDRLFESIVPVLATIRHGDAWAEKYKTNIRTRVIEVTKQNREQLPDILFGMFFGSAS